MSVVDSYHVMATQINQFFFHARSPDIVFHAIRLKVYYLLIFGIVVVVVKDLNSQLRKYNRYGMYRSKNITIQNKILANYDRQFKQKQIIKKLQELFRFKEVRF